MSTDVGSTNQAAQYEAHDSLGEMREQKNLSPAKRRALLLLNVGTPDSPEPEAVGRYLKQFLMDKWVINSPALLRWFLVNVLIVPKRKFASSEAYKTIWTERGSPLLFHLQDLAAAVEREFTSEVSLGASGDTSRLSPAGELNESQAPQELTAPMIEIAMRYGNPSIESGLKKLKEQGATEILVYPLYPQYAESSTRTSVEECLRVARKLGIEEKLHFAEAFYNDPGFIDSWVELIRPKWKGGPEDHLLLTFHGLPESHMKNVDASGGKHCLESKDCCAEIKEVNRNCYRAQSYATARLIAKALGLSPSQYSVSFQSRLGRAPWIRPFTDEVLPELALRGIKNLIVACPSFTADCLETIEEIGDRGRELFIHAGGQNFDLIPCLNTHPRWVAALTESARRFFATRRDIIN